MWTVRRWGTDIHVRHHNMPYHHISIDGFKVVGPTIAISFVVFRLLFKVSRGWDLGAGLLEGTGQSSALSCPFCAARTVAILFPFFSTLQG